MKKLALGVLAIGLFAACSSDKKKVMVVPPDVMKQCTPAAAAGEQGCPADQKCTWILDALTPQYVGHVGCVPDGDKGIGDTCTYGPPGETGYDDCAAGGVCTNFRDPTMTPSGYCKQVCDQQGTGTQCDDTHVCVIYSNLFDLGENTPAAAGVCNLACNPFDDNDYDGSGSDLTRVGTTCGSATEGCYGSPSYGTPPVSGWSCTRDINYDEEGAGFRHRVACTVDNGCADPGPKIYQNSCNQGYLPLLIESTGSSVTICVAFCEPDNCFEGNCGSNNEARLGKPGNQCNNNDRIGSFDGTGSSGDNGEHCEYLWRYEIDQNTNTFLPSQWSDKVGFCFDHTKYQYDSDGDDMPDLVFPPCYALQDGFGSGSDPAVPNEYFGAADLGCVDTTHIPTGSAAGKPAGFERMRNVDMPRPLYNRKMYQP
jgi:hypothetical protein